MTEHPEHHREAVGILGNHPWTVHQHPHRVESQPGHYVAVDRRGLQDAAVDRPAVPFSQHLGADPLVADELGADPGGPA